MGFSDDTGNKQNIPGGSDADGGMAGGDMAMDTDTAETIAQAVERRRQEELKMSQASVKPEEDKTITPEFILECFYANELGDANIYKKLYQGDFVFSKAADSWMSWDGVHWNIDTMDYALASVEGVARVYEEEARRLSKVISEMEGDEKAGGSDGANALKKRRKDFKKRASNLRSDGRRVKCLKFAHTSENPMAIKGDEFDKKPWMLPCANGVINLRTGEIEPGRQKDFLMKSSPVAWHGIDAPCPTWESSILEIFSDNQQLVDCFQRICGYSMIGKVIQSIWIVMTGRGRNGKSLIVETMSKVLGPLSGAIRSEMLLDQFRSNSAGPTPDIMTLRGLRMAFASETDDGCRVSPSRVKWLTGNDTINGRNPNDKYEVQFKPSHTLFLLTNHKPHANADDFAFWERMVLLPFDLSFVDREPENENERRADPTLPSKLEAELPGILAWMVRGCLEWQRMGIAPPAAVKEAVSGYRKEEDTIGDFIEECCVIDPNLSVSSTEIYSAFEEWWKTNVSNKIPKQKWFGTRMGRRFERRKSGTVKYFGVALLETGMEGFPDHYI